MWRLGSGDWLDPYRTYNALGPDLRPLAEPQAPPRPPPYPSRVRAFIYACAITAGDAEAGRTRAKRK